MWPTDPDFRRDDVRVAKKEKGGRGTPLNIYMACRAHHLLIAALRHPGKLSRSEGAGRDLSAISP